MKKYYILCIDDEQSVLNQLAIQLEEHFRYFCEFEYAESAEEALQLYHELAQKGNRVWLIICDQVMPGMLGDAFLAHIYAIDRQAIKVLLTGQAGLESTIRAINHAGLNYYIEKPWAKDDLIMIVERLKLQYEMATILNEVQRTFAASIDLYETLNSVFYNMMGILHAEAGSIFLSNEHSKTLTCKICQGLLAHKGMNLPIGTGIIGQVAQTGQLQLAREASIKDMYGWEMPEMSDYTAKSSIAVPLLIKEQVLGVIQVINKQNKGIFTEDDAALLQTLSTGAALAIQNAQYSQQLLQEERIRSELLIAHQIQQGILPDPFEARPGIHFEAINQPVKDVGGDFYDYFQTNEEEFVFFIGDVCGKGVPAAIFMASSRSTLKSQAIANSLPGKVFPLANKLVTEDAQEGMFVTTFYGLYNIQTRRLCFLNAGHTTSLLFRASTTSCASLLNTNLPIGIFVSTHFESAEIYLEEGDKLILYTDGVNEAANEAREHFGVQRIVDLVLQYGHASARELQEAIIDAVKTFSGDLGQNDDITVMIVQV